MFHTSLLKPYRTDTIEGRVEEAPPAIVLDGHNEYTVEKIMAWQPWYKNKKRFLVQWEGYDNPTDNLWIHEDNMDHCCKMIKGYMAGNPKMTNSKTHKITKKKK